MTPAQIRPFNPALAGSTKYRCLNNVRTGYGIGPKYATAWEAWLHTQQHPNRNIPAGVSTPLYYSFVATIDGIRANYGHINVMLPNGQVWSDGLYYGSLPAFEKLFSNLKYVGWGESVNDVRVIEMKGDSMTDDQAKAMAIRIGLLGGMSEAEVYNPAWLDYQWQHIKAEPYTYPTGLAIQIYNGKDWQLMAYKSGHYDEDVKKAYEKGQAEGGTTDMEEVGNKSGLFQRKKK